MKVAAPEMKRLGCQLAANSLGHDLNAFLLCKCNTLKKFLAADTSGYFRRPRIGFEDFAKLFEDCVARLMPVGIIDALEMIEIHQDNPKGKSMAGSRFELPVAPSDDRTAVRQACEGIRESQFFELTILGFDLALQVDEPHADTNTCEQLVLIKRLGKVIVCARGETLDDVLFLGVAGKDDDVRIVMSRRADFLTKFNACYI